MLKREVELVVISDVHLGTYGSRANELYNYLKSIKPGTLVLNGDIVDIWNFRKRYFPQSHLKVIKQIFSLASKGTNVYYLTGNHDEMLRKFSDASFGNIHLVDKLILELHGKQCWIFHGDVFDASIQNARWLAKLGGWGYNGLIALNAVSNWCLERVGRERYSFSRKIKNSVKNAVKYINDFEETAAELAIRSGYDYVICGHIHQPQIRDVVMPQGVTTYLNSGDWIENLSSLEYHKKVWKIYNYQETNADLGNEESELNDLDLERILKKITTKAI